MTRIEIYINGTRADIINDDIHLRINRELWEPAKTTTTQTEWSYSFDLPSSPTNNKIFSHADILAVNGKFHQRYNAQVYADGVLIYDGSLILNEYNAQTKKYNCNLVNIKVNTLEDIFGDEKLTEGEWYVPFSGVPTINSVNVNQNSKYYFPFVCYGAFQKFPILEDEVGKIFTPKHTIDGSNKWWVESFPPSLNVLEEVKRLFENKGYDVGGTAFQDQELTNIYASCNLGDGQSPILNVGNPLFGNASLTISFNNTDSESQSYLQELKYKYERVPKPSTYQYNSETHVIDKFSRIPSDYEYNFNEIQWWNVAQIGQVQLNNKSYIYEPNEMVVVVPADGWYQIRMYCNIALQDPLTHFSAETYTIDFKKDARDEKEIELRKDLESMTPIEIQLIRNYDQNIELIKGKRNTAYVDGNPTHTSYDTPSGAKAFNYQVWQTCYPHERLNQVQNPTSTNELMVGGGSLSQSFLSFDEGGFVYGDKETMAFDRAVSEAFICGFSTLSDGVVAVQKDGKSWSPMKSEKFDNLANVKGYQMTDRNGVIRWTDKNYNAYNTAGNSNYCTLTYDQSTPRHCVGMFGVVQCCAYLKKNDILEVALIQRSYNGGEQKYSVSGTVNLDITAFSDQTKEQLKADSTWNMYSPSRFPSQLNLFNFTNADKKKKDWIDDIVKAFNLEIVTQGKTVNINTKKGLKKYDMGYAINIDDRASSNYAISSKIEYPRTMSVKYKTATKEVGFEESVPQEYINLSDWAEHGDSGYTTIQLSDDSYNKDESNVQTDFSYTYFDGFQWYETTFPRTDSGWTTYEPTTMNINIPILAESKYFVELESDEESFKHDGYGLTQRFWFRQPFTYDYYVRTYDEVIYLDIPTNTKNGLNLSYKDSEKSLLTEYWNIHPLLDSNYVEIEVRITPQEYLELCGGAKVHFDSDIYYVSEISGYDPTMKNPTKLKLVKKTD